MSQDLSLNDNKFFLDKENEAKGEQDLKRRKRKKSNSKQRYLEKKHKNCKHFHFHLCYNFNYFKWILVLSNDVESNPGPNVDNLNIATYNVQGCREFKKLKRVCNRLQKQPFGKNWVFNLQETHLINISTLQYHWKWGSVQSPGSGNSAGVAILYNKSFFDEILDSGFDNDGRYCYLVASKIEEKYLFLNIYAPNDHYKSQIFFENLTQTIENIINNFPLISIIISGDFNFVFDANLDFVGRNQAKQEKRLSQL